MGFLKQLFGISSETGSLRAIIHDLIVILAYALLILDFISKNPPPMFGITK